MILHIVNKSPYSNPALASCLRLISRDDALLLIEDGVYVGLGEAAELEALDEAVPVYALVPDLAARGVLNALAPRIKAIEDRAFVELTLTYPKSQSWF